MAANAAWLLCFLLIAADQLRVIFSFTNPGDAAVLQSLRAQWKNTPPSWWKSDDPCGIPWDGVSCSNSRVTVLILSRSRLEGQLVGDIGDLTELFYLDLSGNEGLTGSLPPRLGNLQKLYTLILSGCGLSGNIPNELGNLRELNFLALNSNKFSGSIPPSLGKLSELTWLDIADNQLTGPLPISTSITPGLDQLKNAKHFYFYKNQISGTIPAQLFSSDMALMIIRFDGNQLSGKIPSTIGLVQTLEFLRLDRNSLTSNVPSNLNNLTNIIELNLSHNNLCGALPNLTGMNSLTYLDLSNNSFTASEAPSWFSTLQSLSILAMEYGSLRGQLPQSLFSLRRLEQVKLRNNSLTGKLNMDSITSKELQLVDMQSNQISLLTLSSGYNNTLTLFRNPVCCSNLLTTKYCQRNSHENQTAESSCIKSHEEASISRFHKTFLIWRSHKFPQQLSLVSSLFRYISLI